MDLKIGILLGVVFLIAIFLMSNNIEPWDGEETSIGQCQDSSCSILKGIDKCSTTDDYLVSNDGNTYFTMNNNSRQYNTIKNDQKLRTDKDLSICKIGTNLCKNSDDCYASCKSFKDCSRTKPHVNTKARCTGSSPSTCTADDCCQSNTAALAGAAVSFMGSPRGHKFGQDIAHGLRNLGNSFA